MTYIRGQKAQFDAWETLGNTGWNWNTLLPYFLKSEHYDPPNEAQARPAAGASYVPQLHGTSGPVWVGYPFELSNGTAYTTVQQTWQRLAQPADADVNSGNVSGLSVWPRTLHRDIELRSDAAQAYYWPIAARPNLRLFQGTATRILWANLNATATGVEYIAANGSTVGLMATKEVILAAGALRTPAILELSGVGNPT
jgi:choline dehydrogenase